MANAAGKYIEISFVDELMQIPVICDVLGASLACYVFSGYVLQYYQPLCTQLFLRVLAQVAGSKREGPRWLGARVRHSARSCPCVTTWSRLCD
jgi:hypothetical protein